MFIDKEIDINVTLPSSNQRPMSNLSFEKGVLEIFKMAEDLDLNGTHDELFKKLRNVVANYFIKGE